MGNLQNIVFVTFLITFVHNEPTPTNIRQMGSSINPAPLNSTSNASFAIAPQKTNSGNSVQNISSKTDTLIPKIKTHSGREHEVESPTEDLGSSKEIKNSSMTKSDDIKPVHDVQPIYKVEVPPQHKSSVRKNGVGFPDAEPQPNITSFTNITNTNRANTVNNNSSVNKTVFHKPTVTESDDQADTIDSKDNSSSKQSVINIEQIDPLLASKENNRSDYIVPIVAVILSVPLVAILISIVYKRGADWWQHRNYKRMDFLIEGMYHQ